MKKQVMKLFGIAVVTFTVSFAGGLSLYTANHQTPAPEQLQAQETLAEQTTASAVIPQ